MRTIGCLAALCFAAIGASSIALGGPGGKGHSHGAGAAETEAGAPGDKKRPARTVQVIGQDKDEKMFFAPDVVRVKRGDNVRFVIRNSGKVDHEFVIGSAKEVEDHAELMKKFPDMEHEDDSSIRLAPGKSGELYWRFTKPGEFYFVCLIPGHLESGMKGTFVVTP